MHLRERHLIKQFQKRRKIFPILGLLGARQVGKSTFLKSIWQKKTSGNYVTFDRQVSRELAEQSPEHFLFANTNNLRQPLVIDEAHKVPNIFDALKVIVDDHKPFGIFSISGSVEFSKVGGVRESLTGRLGLSKLYPFTVREANGHEFSAPFLDLSQIKNPACTSVELETWLERGGIPNICRIRDSAEREVIIEELLNSICFRDLYQLKGIRPNGKLALEILKTVARYPLSTNAEIARIIRAKPYQVLKHLQALENLFVIYALEGHALGMKQARYVIYDAGVGSFLGASREQLLLTLFINEILAQYEYSGATKPDLKYSKTRSASLVDLVIVTKEQTWAICVEIRESISNANHKALVNFLARVPNSKACVLAPVTQVSWLNKDIQIIPWTYVL